VKTFRYKQKILFVNLEKRNLFITFGFKLNIMIMKVSTILFFNFIFASACLAQQLDRISLSSGGSATNEVNYVIGETFNFSLVTDANLIIETGSLGSENNTGGDANFTKVQEIAALDPMLCYPNPVSQILNIQTGFSAEKTIEILIYNSNGQVIYQKTMINQPWLTIDFSNISSGIYYLAIFEKTANEIKSAKIYKQ